IAGQLRGEAVRAGYCSAFVAPGRRLVVVMASGVAKQALGSDLRQILAVHIHPQRFADIQALVDAQVEEQLNALALEGHQLLWPCAPDELAARGDAVLRHIQAERILAETHDMLAGPGIEADKTLQLVGGLADAGGRDTHMNLARYDCLNPWGGWSLQAKALRATCIASDQ